MPRLNRIVETAIYVDDLERAARFYEDILDLEPLLKIDRLYAYNVGDTDVLLVFKRGGSLATQVSPGGTIPPHDGTGPLHICFAISAEELPEWENRLLQKGVAIEGRMTWPPGGQSLYLRDPDGHMLELMTPGTWRIY